METAELENKRRLILGTRSLQVSQSVLTQQGWTDFVVTNDEIVEFLAVFMRELAGEECTHSWRTKVLEGSESKDSELVHRVLAAERRQRPTRLFTYLGRNVDGSLDPVAVAAVSDHVCASFPYDGFPVLARSFIRKEFRGKDLYPIVLKDRIRFCQDHWGSRLKAIHLGSADDRVVHTIERGGDDEISFLYVGDEWLTVAGERSSVRDYLALSAAFRGRLIETAHELAHKGGQAQRVSHQLGELILRGGEHASFTALRSSWEELLSAAGGEPLGDVSALREFVSMCSSIPITS